MEESFLTTIPEAEITGIRFALATRQEICTASVSDFPIGHGSQLSNPFLGLPLEFGKCESCGTSEPGKCEGHFGFIELPIPVYHPSHVGELKRMMSLLCLKCLKLKQNRIRPKNNPGVAERLLSSCCEEASLISIREAKTTDGAWYLEMKIPSRSRQCDGFWNFLERYGFRYGDTHTRTLLPCEVMEILKKLPAETRRKLAAKGYFPQEGYILQYIPVPPNCLSVPDVSDGVSVMSSDLSINMLKKVLKHVEVIRSSRSGAPNFESHEVEANELQIAVDQYLEVRGTSKAVRDVDTRFGIRKEPTISSTKAWLEKMRTLFISKGSGFSSRSVVTGDPYRAVNEVGIPYEIAQRITFEERVNVHNVRYLQNLVDTNLCLTYRDGSATYSLREGSKGHTYLVPGQIVHRRIMDGDLVFLNRPPTTHKHSLQALRVYIHEDHTVKINPSICGPLGADFDGDAVHLFYPQSLAAKAEVLELFSVEKQLLSSHNDNLLLQLATDSMLSLKMLLKSSCLSKESAQQLGMFVQSSMPQPSILKANGCSCCWTALQILQTALPARFNCNGERYSIVESSIQKFEYNRDFLQSVINEILTSIFFEKGPEAVLKFCDSLQPMLMEYLFADGFSVNLKDFSVPKEYIKNIQRDIQVISPLLHQIRSSYNELLDLQLKSHIRNVKLPVAQFILNYSALGNLIDSKKESDTEKVVQQIGFLGQQLSDKGKFYSKSLVEDVACLFHRRYPADRVGYPSAEYGLIKSSFFHGLDPYEEMVHSISAREVTVRSSRGLSEPGILFKNLMAILRDVVVCYDGTVRNACSNSVIQFEYGMQQGIKSQCLYPPGEPVGVLAATAMSTPAYKAVLDSSPSSVSSWDLMKEILLCKVKFNNDLIDRRVILYLNRCDCRRKHCNERAAYMLKNHLKKVTLKDVAVKFSIEYKRQRMLSENIENDAGLVGHIHLSKMLLEQINVSMFDLHKNCQEKISSFRKKKILGTVFKKTVLVFSESCSFEQAYADQLLDAPCLMFFWQQEGENQIEKTMQVLANIIYPVLLETVIKGDSRIASANITWVSPEATTWVRNPCKTQKGELALDVVLEKSAVKQSGDAWRIVLDSCLPVLHLIDTRRSIPYAIKQIQELLGISSTFDQAVQRLSSSVSMVTKGILKEHLILLANNMTCAGNLVGFNTGGFKALSRSLNVQVPFTEATLYTPRKCFERAAEKCHVDSLASIVASCSWGKRVTVGTGSQFDILWDKEEMELNQEGEIDVCSFLNMVRGCRDVEDYGAGCLGQEIDDLPEDDFGEFWMHSPEQNDKPVFEDKDEYDMANEMWNEGKSSWVKASEETWDAALKNTSASSSWNGSGGRKDGLSTEVKSWTAENVEPVVPKALASSSWGTDVGGAWNSDSRKTNVSGWSEGKDGEAVPSRADGWANLEPSFLQADDTSRWGEDVGRTGNSDTQETNASSSWGQGRKDKAWNSDVQKSWSAWDTEKAEVLKESPEKSQGWGTVSESDQQDTQLGWGSSNAEGGSTSGKKYQWGKKGGELSKKKSFDGTQGSGEWKTKRNFLPKASQSQNADFPASGIFTVTRQRLDIFTSEEQEILLEIEDIMRTMQRMKSKYNDGDSLSAEDQSYIVENVFNHHPDKAVKMGVGIDHIEIGRHSDFQDSRCFYIVSPDGRKEDFSARKCLDNFIKKKCPDIAELFIEKYFRKSRPAGNRKRNPPKETDPENRAFGETDPENRTSRETDPENTTSREADPENRTSMQTDPAPRRAESSEHRE